MKPGNHPAFNARNGANSGELSSQDEGNVQYYILQPLRRQGLFLSPGAPLLHAIR